VLERKRLGDDRGFLERVFFEDELESLLNGRSIVQINHTLTHKTGTVRGMHFQQPPFAERKFVCCLSGEVFDVAVDLRRQSPTFLSWHAEVLTASNGRTLVIPEGFAHGFQTLVDDCEMLYLHTAKYRADAEDGLNAADPLLAIDWPMTITEMSTRDRAHAMLGQDFTGVAV
jgi:dTDP-4-dehydrorhamnose 3,5-epimerase